MIIQKSDPSDETKLEFFKAVAMSVLLRGCTTETFTKPLEKKARWGLYKDAADCFEQILEVAFYKTAAVWLLTSHLTSN